MIVGGSVVGGSVMGTGAAVGIGTNETSPRVGDSVGTDVSKDIDIDILPMPSVYIAQNTSSVSFSERTAPKFNAARNATLIENFIVDFLVYPSS